LVLEAELLWRKFDRGFTEFVFEGKPVPDLPITRIARDEVRLRIGTDDSPAAGPGLTADDWGRVNDYGVGLYLDGVSLGALDAFATVARLVPDKVDGWRNQARAHLLDSNFVGAESMLRRASEILPNDARTAFFWGRLLEERGGEALEEAVQAYRRCLQTYPKSRDTWERLGRTYLHLERYEDAIKAFLEVLEIDPEHALAHEKRALAYAALAEREPEERKRAAYAFASGEARKAYLKYKIDEDAEKVTLRYRERHPHDHRMTQRVVIHRQTDP
jgi:tetratricopeptide (TPR) repeat protein